MPNRQQPRGMVCHPTWCAYPRCLSVRDRALQLGLCVQPCVWVCLDRRIDMCPALRTATCADMHVDIHNTRVRSSVQHTAHIRKQQFRCVQTLARLHTHMDGKHTYMHACVHTHLTCTQTPPRVHTHIYIHGRRDMGTAKEKECTHTLTYTCAYISDLCMRAHADCACHVCHMCKQCAGRSCACKCTTKKKHLCAHESIRHMSGYSCSRHFLSL